MVSVHFQQANMSCDSEVTVRNEYALRFWNISKPPPTVEYVKAVSALIGASHVLAVFEEDEAIKIFFDDRRYVDTIIKKGIHVLGHHVRADYVVPPGIKVILSNVDPVIPNFDLLKLLSVYGSVVSPVVRPPICDDVEFCHIAFGVRYVYMVLEGVLPSRLELHQGDQMSHIKIEIEDNTNSIPIKLHHESDSEEAVMNVAPYDLNPEPPQLDSEVEDSNTPIVISVQSASDDGSDRTHKATSNDKTPEKCVIPVLRKAGLHIKRKRLTSATQAAKKITHNVKHHKWGVRRGRTFKKARRGRPKLRLPLKASPTSSSNEADHEASISSLYDNLVVRLSPTKPILDDKSFTSFLEEVKHQRGRTPLELARKYLGEDSGTGRVYKLIDQMHKFSAKNNCQNLKLRIGRLIKLLTDALDNKED